MAIDAQYTGFGLALTGMILLYGIMYSRGSACPLGLKSIKNNININVVCYKNIL
jgi:hypothetical protein